MLNSTTKLTPLLLLFICLNAVFGQELDIKSKEEKITVFKDSSFVTEITVDLAESDEFRSYPIFYDTELEEVKDIQLFVKKGKRFKKEELSIVLDEKVDLDHINSKMVKAIPLPRGKDIRLKYKIKCDELIYFSSLFFTTYNKLDTLNYEINIPKEFKFTHNTILKDSLDFFQIDSIQTEEINRWSIKVTPMEIQSDPLQYFGIYKNMQIPIMRTLVVPSSYENNFSNYMNDWYASNTAPTQGLNEQAKKKIDEITQGITDEDELIDTIYSYVKNNFKYVAIEIGMGAFIPSHVNDVFLKKEGDCKDLSNFLKDALNYKGVDSDLALAATFNHISDCNFPSLSSANHVICVAYINGKTILLDPTDPIHLQNTPVQSLQNRTIMIINEEGGEFYKADTFSPTENKIDYKLNLKANVKDMNLLGNFETTYEGISGNFMLRALHHFKKSEFNTFSKEFYKVIFGNQSISNLTIENDLNRIISSGELSIHGKTFEDGTYQYLYLDFIPSLIEGETWAKLHEGTNLNNPFQKKVLVTIELDTPIEIFETIHHAKEGNGVNFTMDIKAVSEQKIECSYDFIFDHIFINQYNVEISNEILKSFKKIINEPILLQKKTS